jgi:hypothetical protein
MPNPIQPTPPAAMDSGQMAEGTTKSEVLGKDVTLASNPDARALFDKAGRSLTRFNNYIHFNAREAGLSDVQIDRLQSMMQKLQDGINAPGDIEVRKKLAQNLNEMANHPLFGGPGGMGHQVYKAAMKGLATQDPLLGLVLSLLFFLIKQLIKKRELSKMEGQLAGLAEGSPLRAKVESDMDLLKKDLAEMEQSREALTDKIFTVAHAAESSITKDDVTKWMDADPNLDRSKSTAIEAQVRSALSKPDHDLTKEVTAFSGKALMGASPPEYAKSATGDMNAAIDADKKLKEKLEALRSGSSPAPGSGSSASGPSPVPSSSGSGP